MTTMTDANEDLTTWLLEQITEDEASARAATDGSWTVDNPEYVEEIRAEDGTCVIGGGRWGGEASVFDQDADALHITRWDPTRVLAECDAKRQIIERHNVKNDDIKRGAPICAECGGADWKPLGKVLEPYPWVMPWPCPTLRLLALPYANRPGYREQWRPE